MNKVAFMNMFDVIDIRHIYRETNGVVHRLTRFTSLGYCVDRCLGDPPDFLQDALYENCRNVSSDGRGQDITSSQSTPFYLYK